MANDNKKESIEITENDMRLFEMQQQTDHMKLAQIQLLISAGCMTVNEVRARFGLESLPSGNALISPK